MWYHNKVGKKSHFLQRFHHNSSLISLRPLYSKDFKMLRLICTSWLFASDIVDGLLNNFFSLEVSDETKSWQSCCIWHIFMIFKYFWPTLALSASTALKLLTKFSVCWISSSRYSFPLFLANNWANTSITHCSNWLKVSKSVVCKHGLYFWKLHTSRNILV